MAYFDSKDTTANDRMNTLYNNWVKTEFQTEALTLIQYLMENRIRHARGPVHPSVPLHAFFPPAVRNCATEI